MPCMIPAWACPITTLAPSPTQDGQLCDIIIDKAALDAIYHAGKTSGNEFLKLYAELTVAAADIKTAVRASRTGKDRAFLEQALAPCDTLDITRLAQAAIEGVDAIGIYTPYERAAAVGSLMILLTSRPAILPASFVA